MPNCWTKISYQCSVLLPQAQSQKVYGVLLKSSNVTQGVHHNGIIHKPLSGGLVRKPIVKANGLRVDTVSQSHQIRHHHVRSQVDEANNRLSFGIHPLSTSHEFLGPMKRNFFFLFSFEKIGLLIPVQKVEFQEA
jgi:hypothetical protein